MVKLSKLKERNGGGRFPVIVINDYHFLITTPTVICCEPPGEQEIILGALCYLNLDFEHACVQRCHCFAWHVGFRARCLDLDSQINHAKFKLICCWKHSSRWRMIWWHFTGKTMLFGLNHCWVALSGRFAVWSYRCYRFCIHNSLDSLFEIIVVIDLQSQITHKLYPFSRFVVWNYC